MTSGKAIDEHAAVGIFTRRMSGSGWMSDAKRKGESMREGRGLFVCGVEN